MALKDISAMQIRNAPSNAPSEWTDPPKKCPCYADTAKGIHGLLKASVFCARTKRGASSHFRLFTNDLQIDFTPSNAPSKSKTSNNFGQKGVKTARIRENTAIFEKMSLS